MKVNALTGLYKHLKKSLSALEFIVLGIYIFAAGINAISLGAT